MNVRDLRVDVFCEALPRTWMWEVRKGNRVLCASVKPYGSKGACLKAFYEVQDYLLHARIFINGVEQE